MLIFELKRTYTARGLVQLGQLYMPLVRAITGRPIYPLLVCQNLTPAAKDRYLVESLEDWLKLVETAHNENRPLPILTLQWRPK